MVPGPSTATVPAAKDRGWQEYIRAFRVMLLARTLDEKLSSLYRAGKIPGGGVYLGKGQEALSVSVGINLVPGDVFAPLIRDGAGRLAFGETVLEAVRTCLGSPLGPMRARDGNVHRGRPKDGYLPMISHLGAMISVVNGVLLARRFQGVEGTIGATCLGEGGTSTGAFHEALNQAAIEKLPLVLVVANNQYAYSTPTSRQFACEHLVDRAVGYGVQGHAMDATSLGACLETLKRAIGHARAGGGPQLVVGTLLRLCGHGEHDDAPYISNELKLSPLGCDCLKLAEETIQEQGAATQTEIQSWRARAVQEVDEAVNIAQHDPQPDPYAERWQALSTRHLTDFQSEA